MNVNSIKITLATASMVLAMAVPSAAIAYDKDDAIKDCEKRLRDEYELTDFRNMSAEKRPDHKYEVTGKTKVDSDKYPVSCKIKDRHVTSVKYDGPEKEGLSDAQKAALGVAAVAAAAAIASKANEDKKDDFDDLDDLVGMRASSGEEELEDHGYDHRKTLKIKDKSIAYWWNSRKDRCIAVTTDDGRYESAMDQPEGMCN
jgi:hypothetical protein